MRESGELTMDTGGNSGAAPMNEKALEAAVAAGTIAMTPEINARLNKYWDR